MKKEPQKQSHGGWWLILLLAVFSVVSLSQFYFPRQPQDLVPLTEPVNRCEWGGRMEVFPLSGMLLGMAYGYMDVHVDIGGGMPPVEFYTDFQMPVWYLHDTVRVWMSQGDYDRLMKAVDERSDEKLSFKAHRLDVYDRYDGWQRYVAKHPHGPGICFALGALTGILSLILLIKKVFYS